MYPDEGPLARSKYVKHMEFMAAGKYFPERLMLAANRVGKTEGVGAYEMTLHLSGRYPDWWDGYRFDRPTRWWCAGDTAKTARDILQAKLLGQPGDPSAKGTGLIRYDDIIAVTPKPGVPDAYETVRVQHWRRSADGTKWVKDGISTLQFKSYDQGRDSFQGTEQDGILLDEEPPLAIYTECRLRTMTTNGLILCTFTPLEGLSETVTYFLKDGKLPSPEEQQPGMTTKYVVQATWDDAPHLSETQKQSLWASIPPYQRDARSKGIPQLGSGAIYPIGESEITCDPFEIPEHWPRVYALDVGWNKTAALWFALDLETSTVYAYSEHYQGHAEPSVHATAIRARGAWIPGVIDPAARGRSQRDGSELLQAYRDLGLDLTPAVNAVEAGIYAVWERLAGGRLKIFKTLQNTLAEYRVYRRDDKGKVVKTNDHLMDCMRYGIVSGLDIATTKPVARSARTVFPSDW